MPHTTIHTTLVAPRIRLLALTLLSSVAGAILVLGLARPLTGTIVLALGCVPAVIALLSVRAATRVAAVVQALSDVIARGLTWLILTPCYYLVITPLAIVLRSTGHDLLGRHTPRSENTTWCDRARDTAARADYYNMF
jgi:hypothetical protein